MKTITPGQCSRMCGSYMVSMPCAIRLCDACIINNTGRYFKAGDFYKTKLNIVTKAGIVYTPQSDSRWKVFMHGSNTVD